MSRVTVKATDKAGNSSTATADFTVDSGTTPTGLVAPDGGSTPYKGKLPSDPNFFAIGVWYESVLSASDTTTDKDAGLNTYIEITSNSDPALIRNAGMYGIHDNTQWSVGSETVAWLINDEIDMWAGPGNAAWTGNYPGQGNICNPSSASCGYTVASTLKAGFPQNDGRLFYNNYGKGVAFWETDAQAAVFMNNYQDIVSADTYWFTDPNISSAAEGGSFFSGKALTTEQTKRGSNYGLTVNRLRNLINPKGSKPVWSFVEVGGPFTENTTAASYIKPAEIQSAVWHSLIAGARGIIYFNHTFAGPYQTQHALRDSNYATVRAAVKTTNSQVKQLAHVFNGSFASFPTAPTGNVKASLRWSPTTSKYYVIAGHAGGQGSSSTSSEFTVPVQSGTVTVLFENRTIPIVNGKFSDTFSSYTATHVYQIN